MTVKRPLLLDLFCGAGIHRPSVNPGPRSGGHSLNAHQPANCLLTTARQLFSVPYMTNTIAAVYELVFLDADPLAVEVCRDDDLQLLRDQGIFDADEQPSLNSIAYHKVRIGLVDARVASTPWELMRSGRRIGGTA